MRVLKGLRSEELVLSAACFSTASALRRFLLASPEIGEVRRALHDKLLDEEAIRSFVSSLMVDFRRGERFVHEIALAGLTVALERYPADFAEKLLRDLATLRLAEMSLCTRVAQECRKYRSSIARRTERICQWPAVGHRELPLQISAWIVQPNSHQFADDKTTAIYEVV